MHDHRHHCGGDWLVSLALLLLMDSNRGGTDVPRASAADNGGTGCAVGAFVLLILLLIGVLVVVGKTHPDPLPSAGVTPAVYTQTEPTPDVAPRAILVEMPAPRAELIALPVRRATLVKLPKAGQVTASVRVH